MMRLFNAYIKSILEYGNLIWNPIVKGLNEKFETIQRNYTSKIEELKDFDYHKRLQKEECIVYKGEEKDLKPYVHGC